MKNLITVTYVDHMGSDDNVVDAARVSFDKRADQYDSERNERLIKYLADHAHNIPFAHTAITVRVTAPISIRTQCFKHKVGFVENEISRRYVTDEPSYYVPEFRTKADNVKQGSGGIHEENEDLKVAYISLAYRAIAAYKAFIEAGVAPEQARFLLPQGVMTEWVWTGSLLAFARFYNLRSKEDAQAEVREVAEKVGEVMTKLYPISWKALTGKTYD